MGRDWARWHDSYDDPSSPLAARLAIIQSHLADALAAAPPGPVSVLSLCAGQGRDVLGVLPGHPRRDDVRAVLVELDPRNAAAAAAGAAAAGLAGVQVRAADAGLTAAYADALPAGVLLLCGIFGNVSEPDIARTVAAAPRLCAPGGTVIWTRHRRPPDRTPAIRDWFAAAGFAEVAFEAPGTGTTLIGVGVHRLPPGQAAAPERSPAPPTQQLTPSPPASPPASTAAADSLAAGRLFTFTR